MSRATETMLEALHGLLAGALTDELERAMSAKDEGGKAVPINPQLLDKVMKFLKDNGIDSPGRANKQVNSLIEKLGNLDLDDEAMSLRN